MENNYWHIPKEVSEIVKIVQDLCDSTNAVQNTIQIDHI